MILIIYILEIQMDKRKTISDSIKSKIDDLYKEQGSVHKVGKILGISHSTVHEHLKKSSLVNSNSYSEGEKNKIRALYLEGFLSGDGKLDDLCSKMGREKTNIVRWAKQNGLTNKNRSASKDLSEGMSERSKEWHLNNEHPRGALGMVHGDDARETISRKNKEYFKSVTDDMNQVRIMKGLKTKFKKGTLHKPRLNCSWKGGWREINGYNKFYRSRWEFNYALILEDMKEKGLIEKWEHEPDTFWFEKIKRGTRSYLPDFKVFRNDGTIYYVEVKGWMDDKSKTKLKRMKKYYPEVEIELVDTKVYKLLEKKHKNTMKGWEK